MTRLHVSEAAALSIVEQADYYSALVDHSLACKWEAAIDEAIHSILRHHEIGSPCRFRSSALEGLRWTAIPGFPKHMIFYQYSPGENTVSVVQVLHGARDIDAIFSEEESK